MKLAIQSMRPAMQPAPKKLSRKLLHWRMRGQPEAEILKAERKLRGVEQFDKLQRADIVVVSFGKSGRTWLRVMLSRYYQLRFGLSEKNLIGFDNLNRKNEGIPRIFFTHDNYLADFTGHFDTKVDFYDTKVVLLVAR